MQGKIVKRLLEKEKKNLKGHRTQRPAPGPTTLHLANSRTYDCRSPAAMPSLTTWSLFLAQKPSIQTNKKMVDAHAPPSLHLSHIFPLLHRPKSSSPLTYTGSRLMAYLEEPRTSAVTPRFLCTWTQPSEPSRMNHRFATEPTT